MAKKESTTTTKNGTTISIDVESTTTEQQPAKEKFNWWKFALIALLVLGAFIGGIFLGRKLVRVPQPGDPIYVPGDTVKIEVEKPVPVKVIVPADTANIIASCVSSGKYWELFPEKVRDSLVYIPTSQDTLDIIKDWATERFYEEKVFDVDTLGTATIKAKTQYNRLSVVSAEVVPVVKTVEYMAPPKKFEMFLGAGFSSSPAVVAEAGFFVKEHWGGALMYQYDFGQKKNVFGGAALYKF